jgi:hypothetical protein
MKDNWKRSLKEQQEKTQLDCSSNRKDQLLQQDQRQSQLDCSSNRKDQLLQQDQRQSQLDCSSNRKDQLLQQDQRQSQLDCSSNRKDQLFQQQKTKGKNQPPEKLLQPARQKKDRDKDNYFQAKVGEGNELCLYRRNLTERDLLQQDQRQSQLDCSSNRKDQRIQQDQRQSQLDCSSNRKDQRIQQIEQDQILTQLDFSNCSTERDLPKERRETNTTTPRLGLAKKTNILSKSNCFEMR